MTTTNTSPAALKLTPAMYAALAWIDGRPGMMPRRTFRVAAFATGHGPARNTLKAMAKLGLLTFEGATEWRHGVGNEVAYRTTDLARGAIAARRFGGFLATLANIG